MDVTVPPLDVDKCRLSHTIPLRALKILSDGVGEQLTDLLHSAQAAEQQPNLYAALSSLQLPCELYLLVSDLFIILSFVIIMIIFIMSRFKVYLRDLVTDD